MLLSYSTETLQWRIRTLQQNNGLSAAQLVAVLHCNWSILAKSSEHLAALRYVLQRKLGMAAAQWAKQLYMGPQLLASAEVTVRERVQALVKVGAVARGEGEGQGFTEPACMLCRAGLPAAEACTCTATTGSTCLLSSSSLQTSASLPPLSANPCRSLVSRRRWIWWLQPQACRA